MDTNIWLKCEKLKQKWVKKILVKDLRKEVYKLLFFFYEKLFKLNPTAILSKVVLVI